MAMKRRGWLSRLMGRTGLAGLVRSASGGLCDVRRRGTVMVLIVSALALISVLIVAYVAVGRSDRRSGAQAIRANVIEDQISRIVEYHLNVIGRDAMAVFSDGWEPFPLGSNVRHIIYRDATDYPFTDPTRYSQPTRENLPGNTREEITRFRFDPSGTLPSMWQPGDFIYPFRPSDPWLASLRPTWLDPTTGGSPQDRVNNSRDWWQISNFAPDGLFVNLFNLRNNFNAEPGLGTVNGQPRMSQNLTLLQRSGESYPLTGSQLDYGGQANRNVPAHWTMRQQRAFRPAVEVRWPVGDGRYLHYQWADTDGDGFVDARWIELVDATDPDDVRWILPRDGQFRWFVASRAVDLSGLVNVNVATDARRGPNDTYRLGATPADIDLRRLLSMDDLWRALNISGYSQLTQPVGGTAQDYRNYRHPQSLTIGRTGFAALRMAIEDVTVPGPNVSMGNMPPMEAQARFDSYRRTGGFLPGDTGRFGATGVAASSGVFGLMDLVELLTFRGVNDDTVRSRLEQALGGRDFANANFSPLRDNRSRALDGALDYDNNGQARGASLIWSASDIRQFLTTISGSRPIRSARIEYDVNDPTDLASAMANLEWRKEPSVGSLPDGKTRFSPIRIDAADTLERATQRITDDNGAPSPERERDRRLAIQRLFAGYADALLPFSGANGAWNPTQYPQLRTLHYGYNAEFALRTAAQMTINMIDLFDGTVLECISNQSQRHSDTGVTAVTVLLDGGATGRGIVQSNMQAFPWWHAQDGSGRLDLDEAVGSFNRATGQYVPGATRRLADLTGVPNSPPVALNMFGFEAQPFLTEVATYFMYTDTPFARGGDREWTPGGMTGPFEEPPVPGIVTINGSTPGGTDNPDFITHVVAFQLANPFDVDIMLDTEGMSMFSIEFGGRIYSLSGMLPKRSSKVFYALSWSPEVVQQRLERAQPALGPIPPGESTRIEQWASAQFTVTQPGGGTPVPPVRVTPEAGATLPGAPEMLLAGPAGAIEPRNREALLWRRLPAPTGQANGPQHRMLADRIRDPGDPMTRPTLDRRLGAGNHEIANTVAGEERETNPGANPFDNTGYSITLWAKIRRPDDPGLASLSGDTPRGAIPAWCMELKYGSEELRSLNVRRTDGVNLTTLTKADFNGEGAVGDTTLMSMIVAQSGASVLVPSIKRDPSDKKALNELGATIPQSAQRENKPFHELYAEAHLQNGKFRVLVGANPCVGQVFSKLRGADMLLPLAIGAVQDPLAPGSASEQWTTFGESLAMALGYDDPNDVRDPLRDLYTKLDRGSLRLDAFVPFVDEDANGRFHPLIDYRLGHGVPLALNVLDIFTATPSAYGSLTRATVGTININTAPVEVMRLLPGLSPPPTTDALGQQQWWWTTGAHDSRSDIPATIKAYRDKTVYRPIGSGSESLDFVGLTNVPGHPLDYTGRGESAVFTGSATRIEGLREEHGFMTPAELLAVRDRNFPSNASYPAPHDMDRLGRNAMSLAVPGTGGVDSIGYGSSGGLGQGGPGDDQIIDEHDEQLALLNGVLSSVSTRSDFFAVWFVIHGYQRSDVENLSPNDPLVPSVARRYLMIVDRSNVVRLGDRPRVLVLRELPM